MSDQLSLSYKGIRSLWLPICLAIFFFLQPMLYAAETDRILSAIGTGRIPQGNVASGRQQAVANGLVSIVYQAVASLLTPEALSNNFQALAQAVYSQPNQYIQDFKVQVETAKGTTYHLVVEATISMERLAAKLKDMGILRDTKVVPRVLYLISEKLLEDPLPKTWWTGEVLPGGTLAEPPIIQAINSRGFDYFDPGIPNEKWQLNSQISDRKAQELGMQLGVDLIVIGTTMAGLAPNTMDGAVQSYLGTVELHVLSTESGDVLTRTNQSAISADADAISGQHKALTSAAEKAAKNLANQLATVWLQRARKQQQLEILVSGIGGKIAQLVQFRRALNEIDGIKNLQMKEMTSFSAKLQVDYKGPPQGLAEALMVQSFKNFGINIYQVNTDGIKLELINNQ